MKNSLQIRIFVLALTILAMFTAVTFISHHTVRQLGKLRKTSASIQIASFQMVDQFHALVVDFNVALLKLEVSNDSKDETELQSLRQKMADWIGTQKFSLDSDKERALLEQIDRKFNRYMGRIELMTRHRDQREMRDVIRRELPTIIRESSELINLGNQLGRAHRETIGLSLSDYQETLRWFQHMIVAMLALAIAMGIWLAIMVYRQMITPLRLQLVESQQTISRQEKLASLGVLAAGVAHEVRNPLTAIRARLFTQQRRLREGSLEHQDSVLIATEIERLEQIVQNVLQFARPAEPNLDTIYDEDLLEEVGDLMQPQFTGSEIELRIGPVAKVRFQADRRQIKQALVNLIRNAGESIDGKGMISLRSRTGFFHFKRQSGRAIFIDLEDTGKGMPADIQRRLFDPFFSTKANGTGLGLAITARIVENHAGAIQYRTQTGRGTTFTIILPTAENHEPNG